MRKNAVHDVMANAGRWSRLAYNAVFDGVKVSAYIPQTRLKKDGAIPKAIVELLRKPCLLNKKRLLVFFGVYVEYTYLPPPANSTLAVA